MSVESLAHTSHVAMADARVCQAPNVRLRTHPPTRQPTSTLAYYFQRVVLAILLSFSPTRWLYQGQRRSGSDAPRRVPTPFRPRRRRRMSLGASHRRAGRGGIRACCRTKWDGEWPLGDLIVRHRKPGLLTLASRVRAMRCAGSLVADAQAKSWTYGPVIVGRVEDVVARPHRRRHVQHHL